MSMVVQLRRYAALTSLLLPLVLAVPLFAQEESTPPSPSAEEIIHAEAEHALHEEAGGGPNPLTVDPDLAIWTGVIFLLLFLILHRFAWPQISEALEAREKKIASNIAAAEALNDEAKRRLAEHEAKLAAAAGEVRELLEEARRDAEATKARIAAEARKAADDERARALREIEQAKDGAIQELAVASANVAVDLARKVVRQKLTADEQSSLVRSALDNLAAAPSKN